MREHTGVSPTLSEERRQAAIASFFTGIRWLLNQAQPSDVQPSAGSWDMTSYLQKHGGGELVTIDALVSNEGRVQFGMVGLADLVGRDGGQPSHHLYSFAFTSPEGGSKEVLIRQDSELPVPSAGPELAKPSDPPVGLGRLAVHIVLPDEAEGLRLHFEQSGGLYVPVTQDAANRMLGLTV
jgi:hypothetical protein